MVRRLLGLWMQAVSVLALLLAVAFYTLEPWETQWGAFAGMMTVAIYAHLLSRAWQGR